MTPYYPQKSYVINDSDINSYLRHHPGDLVVTCWCDQRNVPVPAEWVKEGKTRTCGHPKCHP